MKGARSSLYREIMAVLYCSREESAPLTKQQVAAIGTFFMPVERLVNDHAIYWSSLTAREKNIKIPNVVFEENYNVLVC